MIWVIYLCTKMSSATLFCIDLYIQTRTFMHICQIILLLWIEEMMSEQNIQNINQMIRIYRRKNYAIWNDFMKLSYTVPSYFMKYLVKNLWTPAVICCVPNITISYSSNIEIWMRSFQRPTFYFSNQGCSDTNCYTHSFNNELRFKIFFH